MALIVGTMGLAFASAPDELPAANSGSITINNAGVGETYKIFKFFDAEVGANGAIMYSGTIPTGFDTYFEVDSDGYIKTITPLDEDALFDDLQDWAATQTADSDHTIVADASTITFDDLPFGYYVVTSTQGNGAAIMVTSTNPSAEIFEKNTTEVSPTKTVDDHDYSIGDTIEYTVTFHGANYAGSGEDAKIVTKYTVTDTLPAFLTNAHVSSITVATDPATSITGKDFSSQDQ